jgi:hypothetical protein
MTAQELALKTARKLFGRTALTEHHINYVRVGFKQGKKIVSVVDDTWTDALNALQKRTSHGN